MGRVKIAVMMSAAARAVKYVNTGDLKLRLVKTNIVKTLKMIPDIATRGMT